MLSEKGLKMRFSPYMLLSLSGFSCQVHMGNNPMVGATVAVAVLIEEAAKENRF